MPGPSPEEIERAKRLLQQRNTEAARLREAQERAARSQQRIDDANRRRR